MHNHLSLAGRTDIGMHFPRPGSGRHTLKPGDAPANGVSHTFDLDTIADTAFLASFAGHVRRPNLLVHCAAGDMPALVWRMTGCCAGPLRTCALPGPLTLPREPCSTLLLHDVSTLVLSQQIALFDWMTTRMAHTQVVSVTSVPLAPLVEDGQFLQGLFYRLNVVQASAARASSPGA